MNYFMLTIALLNIMAGIQYILTKNYVLGSICLLASGINFGTVLLGMGWK